MESAVAVLGAGPAGLTAGYLLAAADEPVVVLEADDQPGGLSKTVVRDGYRFDLGGHRFFTKSPAVRALWDEVLGDDLLRRPRLSRIYWNGRYLDYPLDARDVVAKLGAVELARCGGSYARAAFRRRGGEDTFEEWVTARFGRRLFELFFRSYTEKVWGVSTGELRAEWAAQRIRSLSFVSAARSALGRGDGGEKSLIREFLYPRLGPGQMWEAFAERIEGSGGEVRLGSPVEWIELENSVVREVCTAGDVLEVDAVVSSLPLADVVRFTSEAPAEVTAAARGLRYRDFLTVAIAVAGDAPFPDNWIYVHDPAVRVARIQNYGAWSPAMLPRPGVACLGLEYFCFEGDNLWTADDATLIELAAAELERLGLVAPEDVERGWVVRVPRAYPMYDAGFGTRVAVIRRWLDGIGNFQQVGRNGLHRYNNSDHSMLTAICAVENLLDGAGHDLWAVNADSVYLEEGEVEEQPYRRLPPPVLERV